MRHAVRIVILVLSAIFLIHIVSTSGQGEEWTGRRADLTAITEKDLSTILEEHKRWIETGSQQGRQCDLPGANLSKANLIVANLSGANLSKAILGAANLSKANLSKANLSGAELNGVLATFSDFSHSWFEPEKTDGLVFLGAEGLSSIRFHKFQSVVDLRKVAKESGLRNEERALTAALRKYRLRSARFHERIFEYILLDLPTNSGANPWRSLWVLALSILVFFVYYVITLRKDGTDGIWKVWIPERVRKDLGEEKPVRLTLSFWAAFRTGLYFSALSAFSIGWRELTIANWIARIQRREYTLRATGWARTVSGLQSVISVYLLALWALTYFGRPFE